MPRPVARKWIRGPVDHAAIAAGCWFDPVHANRCVRFVETFCRQSKGRWGGQPLKLMPWQRDFLSRLFGWRRPDGTRRYRRAYLEVAKKNGKSTLVSALVLYLLLADKEPAPEVYLNAVDREQAGIVFDEATRMVEASPELSKRLEVVPSKGRIIDHASFGKIQKNSADVASKDGVNASAWVFDEIHRFANREMYDVFRYAGASRTQPLEIAITTAGEDESGIWHELRDYSEKVNAGTVPDWSHLGVIYRADEEDDIDDLATWRKANPSLGTTLKEDDFARDLTEAKESPAKLANFRRLRLNLVTRSEPKFLDPARWLACSAPPADLDGRECYGGLDLSSTNDLTAYVLVFPDGEGGYDVLARFWAPEENAAARQRKDRVPYLEWARQGFLTLTPGDVVDYSFAEGAIRDDLARYDVRKVLSDFYNATQFCQGLQADGVPIEFIRQGFLSLSAPTKELERLVLSRRLRHGNHPILTWCAGNAIAETDAAGNIKLSKRKSREKIDGMAALVNAIAAAAGTQDDQPSVYQTRGFLSI